MVLIRMAYTSVLEPMDADALHALLTAARAKNARLDITGLLLVSQQHCLQVLEGPPDLVDDLYAMIEADPRHTQVRRLLRERIGRRDFAEWSMGSASIDLEAVGDVVGLEDFARDPTALLSLNEARARTLLEAFRRDQWRQRVSTA